MTIDQGGGNTAMIPHDNQTHTIRIAIRYCKDFNNIVEQGRHKVIDSLVLTQSL